MAAEALIAELQTGRDLETGLQFVVGAEGVLDEAPSYRSALLDLLGQTDPEAALHFSQSILENTQSPDEYALALRNVAWMSLGPDGMQATLLPSASADSK